MVDVVDVSMLFRVNPAAYMSSPPEEVRNVRIFETLCYSDSRPNKGSSWDRRHSAHGGLRRLESHQDGAV